MITFGERPDRRAYVGSLGQNRVWIVGEQIQCGWSLVREGDVRDKMRLK